MGSASTIAGLSQKVDNRKQRMLLNQCNMKLNEIETLTRIEPDKIRKVAAKGAAIGYLPIIATEAMVRIMITTILEV